MLDKLNEVRTDWAIQHTRRRFPGLSAIGHFVIDYNNISRAKRDGTDDYFKLIVRRVVLLH